MNKGFILIAEDDADDRYLVKAALNETGIAEKVVFVENGVELINYMKTITEKYREENFPKFILLDLNMPLMDGREVLKTLKSTSAYRKIPVIVFSTAKNYLEVNHCYDLGANSYIVKPDCYDTLVETIRSICKYWFLTVSLSETTE